MQHDTRDHYDYETPLWAVRLLLFIALGFSLLMFWLFAYSLSHSDTSPFMSGFIALLGTVFLLIVLRPRNWQPWRYFSADDKGIHFPSECPSTATTTWLDVPWSRLGEIRVAPVVGNRQGLLIDLKVSDSEIDAFFRNLKLTKQFHGREIRNDGWFTVAYANNLFAPSKKVAAELNRIQRLHS